ncbi:MAG: hypothetical protein ACUVQ8_02740 [Nitrososphaeria archaeon]
MMRMRSPLTSALTLLNRKEQNTLTSGYDDIDELIGKLKGGQIYLFYGNSDFIGDLIYKLIVLTSVHGKIAYMNNTDYYSEKTIINADRIAFYAKRAGMDPSYVLKQVYFVAAFNELRQPKAAEALLEKIKVEEDTKLVITHRLSRFLEGTRDHQKALENLNRTISLLWHISIDRDIIMVVTTEPNNNSRGLPKPQGTSLMRHIANVIVFFRTTGKTVQAILVKHPEKSLSSTNINFGGDSIMGRITLPFRQSYQELLEKLRRNYVELLRDIDHRKNFDQLVREAWDREYAAMGNAELPSVLDALNLTANIHNKGEVEKLKKMLEEKDDKIKRIEQRLAELEKALGS